jgi:hypothetical protein
MAWRLQITLRPDVQTDFVHGLYLVGLVTCFLEVWLSIIVVSLPALAPLFRAYIEPVVCKMMGTTKNSGRGHLREAQHTIGSGPSQRKANSRQITDSYPDLEDGKYYLNAEISASSSDDESWVTKPNAIGVRYEISVH